MCQYDVNVLFRFCLVFTEQFDHSMIRCMKKRTNRSQDRCVCWNEMLVRRMRSLEPNAHKMDVFVFTKMIPETT